MDSSFHGNDGIFKVNLMSFYDSVNNPSSMTQQLRAAAKQNFSVHVLREHFVELEGKKLWRREVELLVDTVPWMHAVTLIPEETLLPPYGQELLQLGDKPLGDLLALDPNLKRDPFEFSNDHKTRTSIFYFFGKPLRVTETFLPEAIKYFSNHLK